MSGFLSIFKTKSSSKDEHRGSSKGGGGGGNIMNIGTPTNVVHGIHVSKNNITGDLEGLPKTWQRQMDQLISRQEQNENPDAVYSAVKFYNYSIKKKDQTEPFKPFLTEEAIHEESEEIENYMCKNHHKSEDSLGKSSTTSSEENFTAGPLPPPYTVKKPLPPPRDFDDHRTTTNTVTTVNNNVALPARIDRVPSPSPPPIPEKRPITLPPKPKLMPKPKKFAQQQQQQLQLEAQQKKTDLSKRLDDLSKISCIEITAAAADKEQNGNAVNTNTITSSDPLEEPEDEELILREKDPALKRVPKSDEQVYEELRTICNLDDPSVRYQTKVEVCKTN